MRALARWGITPLLAAPLGAWALGLGDIEIESGLNQPFKARIDLSATPEELQSLRVTLASADTFERYGLDRPSFFNSFEFRVVAGQGGRGTIEITSAESIAEPFVTLLLEATWPRGRNLREYTVLLDPPILLPAPTPAVPVQPATTRAPSTTAPGGAIDRPAAPAAPVEPPRQSAPSSDPTPRVSATPPAPTREPETVVTDGVYGPVQRAETLSQIAVRVRPAGVTLNQMMIGLYEANPSAFIGNINLLREGSTLRLPDVGTFDRLVASVATAEVQRHIDEWRSGAARGGQLRLLPPTETPAPRTAAPSPTPSPAPRPSDRTNTSGAPAPSAGAGAAISASGDRRIEVSNADAERLQQQVNEPAVPSAGGESAAPGVDLETEQVFADEEAPAAPVEAEAPAPAPAPAATPAGPSLVTRALGFLLSPLLWIGLGVAALLLSALWFVRRRRQEAEDVTGRWEALESETDETSEVRDATERMRRQLPEQTIVVEEQHAEAVRPAPLPPPPPPKAEPAAPRAATPARPPRGAAEETLSSQTVINLDQADALAEADFHIAYGLYDQAAELVQKALAAAPGRRDLTLKLLEVFFMWGNKDAFLKTAQKLHADSGDAADADWDKVVIMGRQICPDERLFSEAKTGGGRVDVDLEAGDAPLDLAFDDTSESAQPAGGDGLDFSLESTGQRRAANPKAKPAARVENPDALDIGAKTAAGLEAALFEMDKDEDEDTGRRTTPDLPADSLAITQESPTIERPQASDWSAADAPTVETPTIESPAATRSATQATKTLAIPRRGEPPTVEQPALAANAEYTAEIDLDDLGLDVKDLEGLPGDLGELPAAGGATSDTREQRGLKVDDALLSATGVTKVLDTADDDFDTSNTSVLEDRDATMMAPMEGTLSGTEVLAGRHQTDESGSTSLVRALRSKDGIDLDLADLTSALHGSDTVEQPRANAFSRDVFGGGDTPLDMDVGRDAVIDDTPTGTQEVGPLDAQTMTEIGTKLDLARAYIDMGDPEGARSILEEVLDEGDPAQRREAQGLIDVLRA